MSAPDKGPPDFRIIERDDEYFPYALQENVYKPDGSREWIEIDSFSDLKYAEGEVTRLLGCVGPTEVIKEYWK